MVEVCKMFVLWCLSRSLFSPSGSSLQERDGFGSPVGPRGRGRGRGDWNMGAPGALQEVTYSIPADKCGLVIGKGRKANAVSKLFCKFYIWWCQDPLPTKTIFVILMHL